MDIKNQITDIIRNKQRFAVEYINNKNQPNRFLVKKIHSIFCDFIKIKIEYQEWQEWFDKSGFSSAFPIKYNSIKNIEIFDKGVLEISPGVLKKYNEWNLFEEKIELWKKWKKDKKTPQEIESLLKESKSHPTYRKVYISTIIDWDWWEFEEGVKNAKEFRIIWIDAPEKGDAIYEESKNRLIELVWNDKVAYINEIWKDIHGRILVEIFDINMLNIGQKLLSEGMSILLLFNENKDSINYLEYIECSKYAFHDLIGVRSRIDPRIFEQTKEFHTMTEIGNEKKSFIGKYLWNGVNNWKSWKAKSYDNHTLTTLAQWVDKYDINLVLDTMKKWDKLDLVLDPSNGFDRKAIQIKFKWVMLWHIADPKTPTGIKYISKFNKKKLWDQLDIDKDMVNCTVTSVDFLSEKIFLKLKIKFLT